METNQDLKQNEIKESEMEQVAGGILPLVNDTNKVHHINNMPTEANGAVDCMKKLKEHLKHYGKKST